MSVPSLLIVSPCYHPAVKFGGPVSSLLGLSGQFHEITGTATDVVAPRYSGPDSKDDLPVSVGWMDQDLNRVYWVRTNIILQAYDLCLFFFEYRRRYQLYYINGTFNLSTVVALISARIFMKKVIFSPRGAIQAMHEGAGNRKTLLLKRLILQAFSVLLTKTDIVLASSEHELKVSRPYLRRCVFQTLPNIVPSAGRVGLNDLNNCDSRILFLGRLHPKKGIDLVIKSMKYLPRAYNLDVCGAGAAEYVGTLKALVADLGLEQRVNFCGFADGSVKEQVLRSASVLVLPSQSENFGNVILESLSHGTPVVISKNMPFQDVEEYDVGRVSERDSKSIAQAISSLPTSRSTEMSERCREYSSRFCSDEIKQRIESVFGLGISISE